MFEILNARAWALETNFFNRVSPIVLHALQNGSSLRHLITNPEDRPKAHASIMEWDDSINAPFVRTESGKKIAYMSVIGSMTKRGGLCSYGMKDLGRKISRFNAVDHIDAIIIEFDTPGGTVDGTPDFGRALKNSKKPIVSYIDGMMCSAGYWAGSQTNYIIANAHNPGMIGSIGTLCMHIDQSEYLKKEGLKVEIIRAEKSKDKARGNSIEGLPDDARAKLIEELNQITESFIATVKAGRGDRLKAGDEDIFTGKVYSEKEALDLGMIDGIGTFEDAVAKAEELATIRTQNAFNSPNNSKNANSSDMKILKILGLAPEAEAKLSEEERARLEAAENKLAEIEANAANETAALQASLDAALAENEALKATNTGLANKVSALETKVEELEKRPEENHSGAHHTGDANGGNEPPRAKDEQAHHFARMGAAYVKQQSNNSQS